MSAYRPHTAERSARPHSRPGGLTATSRQRQRAEARGNMRLVVAGGGMLVVILVITAGVTGEWGLLAALGILLVVVGVFGSFFSLQARNASLRDPAARADRTGRAEPAPIAFATEHDYVDDDSAMGFTSEDHDEVSPHDLPLDHPGRKAADA